MNWKYFLKPTISKIIISVAIIVLTSLRNSATYCPGCTREAYGFPLTLYELPGCEPVSVGCPSYAIVYIGLLVDIVFWYIISSLLIWLYYKVKKK